MKYKRHIQTWDYRYKQHKLSKKCLFYVEIWGPYLVTLSQKKKIIHISPIADLDMPFPTAPNRGFTFPNYNCHLKGSSQKRHETTNYPWLLVKYVQKWNLYIIEFYRWFLHVFARCILELNLIVFFRLHLLPIRNMSKTPTAKCCQPGRKPSKVYLVKTT